METEFIRLENQAQVSTYSAEWQTWEPQFGLWDYGNLIPVTVDLTALDYFSGGRYRVSGNEVEFYASLYIDDPWQDPTVGVDGGNEIITFSLPLPSIETQLLAPLDPYDDNEYLFPVTLMNGAIQAGGYSYDPPDLDNFPGAPGILCCFPVHTSQAEWDEGMRSWAAVVSNGYDGTELWRWHRNTYSTPECFYHMNGAILSWTGRYVAA